jgi:uncharacterized protein
MSGGPDRRLLPDGHRFHLQHGPIDLIIEAWGERAEIEAAYAQAWRRFATVLPELVAELPLLRRAADDAHPGLEGKVARRMLAACRRHRPAFLTPMAAVAGAVADEVLAAMLAGRRLARAYVNNGGDIAFHLAPGERLDIGLIADITRPALTGSAGIPADWPVRGVATSGWRGRSFSLGIADVATVLAEDGAAADAAATLVANAVDVDHPAIARRAASALDETSDLGDRLVTTAVPVLPPVLVEEALRRGAAAAAAMRARGLIFGAVLAVQGRIRVVGEVVPRLAPALAG